MRIFGDDGFRDVYGVNLLGVKFLNHFFNNLNFLFKRKKINKIIIGYDNRVSNKQILKIILNNVKIVKTILMLIQE